MSVSLTIPFITEQRQELVDLEGKVFPVACCKKKKKKKGKGMEGGEGGLYEN